MANEKVTDLPTVVNSDLADIMYAVQGGVSVRETLQQISDLIGGEIVLSAIGDPNGAVAGTVKQLLLDTTNSILWMCTTTGTASTAVWQTTYGTLTDGQLIIGNTGTFPTLSTLTAGTGITVINSSGGITIAAVGTPFPWNDVSGTSENLLVNNGYVANNAGLVTLLMPSGGQLGDRIEIVGLGAGGWIITQPAGVRIHVGSVVSTTGVGGSVASINNFDSIVLTCVGTPDEWSVVGSPQGNLTII